LRRAQRAAAEDYGLRVAQLFLAFAPDGRKEDLPGISF